MPPYLLGETPWAGAERARVAAGLLFAWLGHAWSQASYDDVPVDCLYPLALYMQGIWAATVAVALLTGRQLGRQLAPLVMAGGAHGGQLVSPGGFAAGRDEPHMQRPGGPGGTLPNYRCYRCSDGQWLFFGAFTSAFIDRGLRAAGAAWLLDDPRVGGDPARRAAAREPGLDHPRTGEDLPGRARERVAGAAARPRTSRSRRRGAGGLAGPRAGARDGPAPNCATTRAQDVVMPGAADRAVADPGEHRAGRGHHPAGHRRTRRRLARAPRGHGCRSLGRARARRWPACASSTSARSSPGRTWRRCSASSGPR